MIRRWNRQYGRHVFLGGGYAWAEIALGKRYSLFVWRYKGMFRKFKLFELTYWGDSADTREELRTWSD